MRLIITYLFSVYWFTKFILEIILVDFLKIPVFVSSFECIFYFFFMNRKSEHNSLPMAPLPGSSTSSV